MKLLLNTQLGLRGWLGKPRVLFDINKNSLVRTLDLEEFDILKKCDGNHDLENNDIIKQLLNANIIHLNEEGKKLEKNQQYKFFNNRYFHQVRWGLTERCNYKCRHCFMASDGENRNDELSLEDCLDIANQIADCGIERVIFTGGEPLLRNDFFDIVDELLKRNVKIASINTNGSLITKEFIDEIIKRNIKPSFSISFDGIGYHNWMRGVDGAEKDALNAIKMLVQNDFHVISVCCIHQGNFHVLNDTVELMNSIGVSRVEVYRTAETLRWSLLPEENKSLSYEDCYDAYIDLLYAHKKKNWNVAFYLKDFCFADNQANILSIVPLKCNETSDFSKQVACWRTRDEIFIAPDGQVLPCNGLNGYAKKYNMNFENLKDMKLKDILTKSNYLSTVLTTVQDLFDRSEECRNCEYREKCGGGHCRVIAFAGTGDFYGKDESTCAFFKGGYEDKIKKFMNS